MTAIREAIDEKRALENGLREQLRAFSKNTGLLVESIDIVAIETSTMESEFKEYGGYQVELVIRV